jgi:hypothetical protein
VFCTNDTEMLHENIPENPNGHVTSRIKIVIDNVLLVWTVSAYSLEGASVFYRYFGSIGMRKKASICRPSLRQLLRNQKFVRPPHAFVRQMSNSREASENVHIHGL